MVFLVLRTCAVLLLLLTVYAPEPDEAAAQASRGDSTQPALWHVGGFVGIARNSPMTSLLGLTPGRDHYFVGLHALTPVLRSGAVSLSYGLQLLPFVGIGGRTPPTGYVGPTDAEGKIPGPDLAYAFGLSPFGIELGVLPFRGVGVYAAAAAGGVVFRRPFPIPEARRTNFTLEFGGGLRVHTGRGQWLRLGYKYHHLSNSYRALANPGLDGHVFYAGYYLPVRLPR